MITQVLGVDSTSTLDKILIALAISALSTIFGLLGSFISNRWLSTAIPQRRELKLLSAELDDILRHCNTNLEILSMIDLKKGIPSSIHFEKMKVPESSILFSPETFRRIHFKYSGLIYRLKLNIRNRNIELIEVANYTLNNNVEEELLGIYLVYLEDKMNYLIEKIIKEKTGLNRNNLLEIMRRKTFIRKILFVKRNVSSFIKSKVNFFIKKTDTKNKAEILISALSTNHFIIYREKFKVTINE